MRWSYALAVRAFLRELRLREHVAYQISRRRVRARPELDEQAKSRTPPSSCRASRPFLDRGDNRFEAKVRLDHPRRDRGDTWIGRAAKAAGCSARWSGDHDRLNEPLLSRARRRAHARTPSDPNVITT